MRKYLALAAGAAAMAGAVVRASAATAAEDARPNIVLILADDLGYQDTGFTGSDFMETPNLDRLAKQGMVFGAAYAAAANCAPSRACLISGQYTPRHGVFAVSSTDRGPKSQQRLVPIPNKSGLAPSVVTVAESLKASGYATGMFGKWHLGGRDGAPPSQQGFDTVFEPQGRAEEDDEGGAGQGTAQDLKRGTPQDPKSVFAITDAAGGFMEKNSARPFFAYLAHHAPHAPLAARPETLAKFRAKARGQRHSNPLYAACIYDLDASIGRLMEKVAALGLDRKTLVVFTSDNGGLRANGRSQEPLRGNKGAYYEAGIRVPMWVRWPGVVRAGASSEVPVSNIDFFPTFLDAAKATKPADKILDGQSLLPLLNGQAAPERSLFWHFPGYLDKPVTRGRDPLFRTRPVSAMRRGDWKLLLYHEEWQLDGGRASLATNHAVELYNLKDDIGERRDLANELPAQRDALLQELLTWVEKTQAPLPSQKNPAYAPEPAPAP